MTYLLARMKEPSTYAALAALLAIFGFNADPGLIQSVASVGVAVSGLAAMLMRG